MYSIVFHSNTYVFQPYSIIMLSKARLKNIVKPSTRAFRKGLQRVTQTYISSLFRNTGYATLIGVAGSTSKASTKREECKRKDRGKIKQKRTNVQIFTQIKYRLNSIRVMYKDGSLIIYNMARKFISANAIIFCCNL